MSEAHILVVDDEPDIRGIVQEILEDEDYEVSVAEDAESARHARRLRRPDLVLLDIWMPDTDGISLLKEWAGPEGQDVPVIMMSGHGTVETAVEATRLGAYDFIEKPLSMAKLLLSVRHALEHARLRRENIDLRRGSQPESEPVGRSPAMRALREQAQRIAQHDTPVLILGDSGTGKETLARFLHENSPRRGADFVRVATGGLGPTGSELFGAEDGTHVHYGSLEQASGGTLYLEDVADMAPALQARLLGALQSDTFLRVDGLEPVAANVRVVAATAADPAEAIRSGRLREDLYYLLNVVPLRVPPLRERRDDLPDLVEHYLDLLVTRDNLPYRRFTVGAQNRLRNHDWPGNVRELRNVVQRLLILGTGPEVDAAEVSAALGQGPSVPPHAASAAGYDTPLRDAREAFERGYLEHMVLETGGNITRVAERSGLERTHLYRKMRALGIDPKRVLARGDGSSRGG